MSEYKTFLMRLPKDVWIYLKNKSMEKEIPMSQVVLKMLKKMKKKEDKNTLTSSD